MAKIGQVGPHLRNLVHVFANLGRGPNLQRPLRDGVPIDPAPEDFGPLPGDAPVDPLRAPYDPQIGPKVVHKRREFAQDGAKGRVSTNAAKRPFPCITKFFRLKGAVRAPPSR